MLFELLGAAGGLVLAVVPLMLWMKWETARTGYDAPNAGVLLVCTVPILVPAGAVAGSIHLDGMTGNAEPER